ncbi:MAG: hypothetical protein C3L25_03190 [Candidatus Sedimenticola endophacoides]|uniref:diguanylate cyclase n=1 Tax=Candidatus Sedimenticola endophacoides TaxID=2548426 RepID=A0A6N4E3D4_9GAMM|nr:MAG: hypothetical protein C3L26_03215 [Candidatus Sedimenticola endophacoides]PUE03406.1 MAG: hypothetical protein C3L24_04605 [Candidatus Sedimenticola endophacoides]PUE04746.1 MAG: hypothetical protein C3L25_03190 [Candidatus Sedimenticola endophacoides]
MPEIYFKLASNNPRNKINRADPKESELLERMNRGELTKYRELQQDADGNPSLYVAMATDPVVEGCLVCHGDPEDAPREMVARYPQAEGYYEKKGDIRALISIRIPLADHLEDARRIANILIFITAAILSVVYFLIWLFLRNRERQRRLILAKNVELEKISTTDYLTGIHNRLGFMRLAEQAFSIARRYEKPLSLVMFDLDDFKQVNDRYGHDTGDQVLRALASLVKERLRSSDIFGRIGGEEFLILVVEQDLQGVEALAEELRKVVLNASLPHELRLTVSLGIVRLSGEKSLSEMIIHADRALYRSKHEGKNRASVYRTTV